jgi:hypothetical protein
MEGGKLEGEREGRQERENITEREVEKRGRRIHDLN